MMLTSHDLLAIASFLAHDAVMFWLFAAVFLTIAKWIPTRTPPRWVAAVYHELRPFYLPAVAVGFLADSVLNDPNLTWRLITLGVNLFNWVQYKDAGDGDDRWKRRKAKLVEKVAEVGGRLTVVPAALNSWGVGG